MKYSASQTGTRRKCHCENGQALKARFLTNAQLYSVQHSPLDRAVHFGCKVEQHRIQEGFQAILSHIIAEACACNFLAILECNEPILRESVVKEVQHCDRWVAPHMFQSQSAVDLTIITKLFTLLGQITPTNHSDENFLSQGFQECDCGRVRELCGI